MRRSIICTLRQILSVDEMDGYMARMERREMRASFDGKS
jgi:hypothetical protein